ncbi:MAG: sugar phosphate isomerase/epimerase [Lentisphaerales bacterium]|nr:MAG: sugar phosphate isomerase/epimerase [Lentisphaerales bacterium]
MILGLSTRWNASRHTDGEALVEEILELGLNHIELGYDLSIGLVAGVGRMVEEKAVVVDSVHAFCPVPLGVPFGHPELFSLASMDRKTRESAILHTVRTLQFAAEMGARTVVLHAGNVKMGHLTQKLSALYLKWKQYTPRYERVRSKLVMRREKHAQKQFDHLISSLEEVIPILDETGVSIALENLPSWESIPTELEMEQIIERLDSPRVRCWHDIGHGYVRQCLGFVGLARWLDRLAPHIAGLHVHDVKHSLADHYLPPTGEVDFLPYKRFADRNIPTILEPMPRLPADDVKAAIAFLSDLWQDVEPNNALEETPA